MKKLVCLAALLAMTACNDTTTETPPAEATPMAEATPAEAAAMTIDGKPSYGTFKVTDADGTTYDYDVREDGTYTTVSSDGETVTGTWTETTPGKWCETPADGDEACYTETIGEDGKIIATSDADQSVATVERIES